MHHDEQVRILQGLLTHLDNGTNVDIGVQMKNPVSAYTCPDRATREWRELFQRHPHVLGLSSDLPEPGAFFTSDDLGKPILCTRDTDGTFGAFLNVCRHRGVVVETEKRGRKKLFVCPFHAWSYDTGGDLVAVPKEDHFGAIDKTCNSLVPLPAVEKHGLLWVSADPEDTFDIDDLLGDLGPELASWRFAECAYGGSTTYHHACNWKLANDTYGETYHFEALHNGTLAADFYGNVQAYQTFKRNHRMTLCMRSIDALRNEPTDTWHILRGTAPVYFLFPNVQLILTGAGPILVRIYPDADDPHNSRSEISWYTLPKDLHDAIAGPGFERPAIEDNVMESFAAVIQAEDYVAAASSHVGARSGALETVRFGRNEPALHHYHRSYCDALDLPQPETVSSS